MERGGVNLIIKVQEFLAIKPFQAPKDALTDSSNSDSSDDLILKIVLLLGNGSNVPFTGNNLLVGGDKIADKGEDSHNDVCTCNFVSYWTST